MGIKEKIEESPAIWLLGVLLSGFLAGLGAYRGILEIAQLKVVSSSSEVPLLERRVEEMASKLEALEEENRKLEMDARSPAEVALLRRKIADLEAARATVEKENKRLQAEIEGNTRRETSSSTAPARSPRLVIQVFTSPVASEAEGILKQMQDLKYNAYISAAYYAGRTMYRVRVGPFSTREDVSSAAESFAGRSAWIHGLLKNDVPPRPAEGFRAGAEVCLSGRNVSRSAQHAAQIVR